MHIKQFTIQKLINLTAYLLPFVSARLSYRLWTSTHRHEMPVKELSVFDSATKRKILVDGAEIMTYTWDVAENRENILLLHGWNGRGTQLSAFVNMLTEKGFGVIAFDARGHGYSDGNSTNILETVAIIKKLRDIHGDFFSMIGHSFGAMAAVKAINEGVACKKFIGISPPTQFSALLLVFSEHLGLNNKATEVLEKYVLKKYKIKSFEQISITGIAPEMKIPCLIIHDKDDDKVPVSQARKAVELWGVNTAKSKDSGAKLHITQGLGHVRILHNQPALKAAIIFLQG